jgi:hypothetical protein
MPEIGSSEQMGLIINFKKIYKTEVYSLRYATGTIQHYQSGCY